MSRRARLVPGHSMVMDGRVPARFGDDGEPGNCGDLVGRVRCTCGDAESAPGLTIHQAWSWHQEHRERVRGLHQDTPPLTALLTPREHELLDAMAQGLTDLPAPTDPTYEAALRRLQHQAATALGLAYDAAGERLKLALRRTGHTDVTALLAAFQDDRRAPAEHPTPADTPTYPHPTHPNVHPG